MKKTLIIFTISMFSIVSAQNVSTKDGGTIYSSQNYVVDKSNFNDNYYIDKTYKKANVQNYSGIREYRYNAFTDDFEYKDGKNFYNLDKNNNLEIRFLDGKIYKYLTFINLNEEQQKGYLELLSNVNAKNVLYKSIRITKSEIGTTSSYNNMGSVKFRTSINYYIGNDELINQVSKSNKELAKVAKENKLNLNKEQDLIKLVDILNKS
ncbi:hypothetical protein [Empedobacter falsenii]|uniref:Uncharacterized protein n=1 Tax=Empedobacter falsenii TaxID=343874 RepID=A0AAW7DLM6_9FLAO|nr:hypothetical protein [Empedobacter falsenii]MDM1552744.1 hypothetical protein [Empedobacter falsenii]